jgi:acetyl esterase/lipase
MRHSGPIVAPGATGSLVSYRPGAETEPQRETFTPYAATSPGSRSVICLHEGGWHEQKAPSQDSGPCTSLVKDGFAAFDVNYPLTPPGGVQNPGVPVLVEAVERAIAFIKAHAGEYNGSTSLLYVAGFSAGGHLGAMAALRMNAAAGTNVVRAVSSWSGPMDLTFQPIPANPLSVAALLGCTTAEYNAMATNPSLKALAEAFSPDKQPFTSAPAFQLFGSSEADRVVYSQQTAMKAACEAHGASVQLNDMLKGHALNYAAKIIPGSSPPKNATDAMHDFFRTH